MNNLNQSRKVFEIKDVTFAYSKFSEPVLNNVSLSVHQGELVGIIGRTASGRSTLLYLLTGVIPHYHKGVMSGEVRVFGQDTRKLKMGQITSKVGFVMQDPDTQLFNLFVRDEIVWGLECRGLAREEMEERLIETMDRFRISYLVDRVTYDLSGGEKQKVTISAIDAIKTEAIIFDNPTSQLDPLGREMVTKAIRKLSSMGQTVLIVDDNIDDLITYADRIIIIDNGQVVMDVTPKEFCLRREEVSRHSLKLPQIAELAHLLADEGFELDSIPITLESGIEEIKKLLSIKGLINQQYEKG